MPASPGALRIMRNLRRAVWRHWRNAGRHASTRSGGVADFSGAVAGGCPPPLVPRTPLDASTPAPLPGTLAIPKGATGHRVRPAFHYRGCGWRLEFWKPEVLGT